MKCKHTWILYDVNSTDTLYKCPECCLIVSDIAAISPQAEQATASSLSELLAGVQNDFDTLRNKSELLSGLCGTILATLEKNTELGNISTKDNEVWVELLRNWSMRFVDISAS